jgi:hypothetical protein
MTAKQSASHGVRDSKPICDQRNIGVKPLDNHDNLTIFGNEKSFIPMIKDTK